MIRKIVALTAVLAAMICPTTSNAGEKDFPWCKSIAYTFWTHSKHPGGDRNGRLNQDNGGIGFKCFLEKENSMFLSMDALENSQFGSTITAGIGKQIDLLKISRVSIYVGGELSLVNYDVPRKHEAIFGVMPSLYRGIGYSLPYGFGIVSFEEKLLLGDIRLRSWGWQYKKSVNIF
ncbi:MAG: hypothetical protein WC444_02680 [Candidatus Paceibacterota bacterium]